MTKELYKLLSVITAGGSSVKSQTKYMKTNQTPFTFDQCELWQMDDFSTTIKDSNILCCSIDRPVLFKTNTHTNVTDMLRQMDSLFTEYCNFCLQSLALSMQKSYKKFNSKWQISRVRADGITGRRVFALKYQNLAKIVLHSVMHMCPISPSTF